MRTESPISALIALLLVFVMAGPAMADGDGSSEGRDPFGTTEPLGAKELGEPAVSGAPAPGSFGVEGPSAAGEGACGAVEGCAAKSRVRVDVSGGDVGDVTVGSFNTTTRVSATNVLESRFGTGTLSFGAADPAGTR